MILYLDTSALVKCYVTEAGSVETNAAVEEALLVGTVLISRAEMSAALAKAVRMGLLRRKEARAALEKFRAEWKDLVRIQATDVLVNRADLLAWEHGLRGYDALQLTAAMIWQETLGEPVTFATYDENLWKAAAKEGLTPFPA
jgi:predicted nucleic acid-binding protein